MAATVKPEAALKKLQKVIRCSSGQGPHTAMTGEIPADLLNGERQYLWLSEEEAAAVRAAEQVLLQDPRFEHLDATVHDKVWRFVAQCHLDRKVDHVPGFLAEHAKEPEEMVWYFPIEGLAVAKETALFGVRLLPASDPRLPTEESGFRLDASSSCALAVTSLGTHPKAMVDRARQTAHQVLRLLRIALRDRVPVHDRQLRFRLGMSFASETGAFGWRAPLETPITLGLSDELVDLATRSPLAGLVAAPRNDLERHVQLALRWMERAWLATDPLVAMLYLFFALEALLGEKSEGLKAYSLAFRQMTLSAITTGHFTHPDTTYILYDRVRSGAVHGEDVPEVTWDMVRDFRWTVRNVLLQYIEYARAQRFTRRSRLIEALNNYDDKPKLVQWLRDAASDKWAKYLDKLG